MTNVRYYKDAWVRLPVAVAAGVVAGAVVALGANGLQALTMTAQMTAGDLADLDKPNPQGLKVGEASAILLGIAYVGESNYAGAGALGDLASYNAGTNAWSAGGGANQKGWLLWKEPSGNWLVALAPSKLP